MSNNNKKRSFTDTQPSNDDGKYQPPNKKQKINSDASIPIRTKTIQYSTNMQNMIAFMQHKPDSFIQQIFNNSIKQYEIFKRDQLLKPLQQTSLTNAERTNKQIQAQYLSIFKAIEQTAISALQIPQIVSECIAVFAIGKVVVCAHNVCDKEIFFILPNKVNYYKQDLFCSDTCEERPDICIQCGTDYNINSISCVGDCCRRYICENEECVYCKSSTKCGRMNCEKQYCGECVKRKNYWNCAICRKVNVGCPECCMISDLWCSMCGKSVCDDCRNIKSECCQCNKSSSTHAECDHKCLECNKQICSKCIMGGENIWCFICGVDSDENIFVCKECASVERCECDGRDVLLHKSCVQQNSKHCWSCYREFKYQN